MNTSTTSTSQSIHSQLVSRRERLVQFMADQRASGELIRLLKEVDAAIERLHDGSYGICEVCEEPIEQEYLRAEPLVRICLTHLTEAQQRAIESDLELAAQVQGKLLPLHNNTVVGWEICHHYEPLGPVSGDYCDLILPQGESGDLYFFFGDVSGKGVAASLLVSHLHAMFRTLLSPTLTLDQLVAKANRLFCESTLSESFATLVCGKSSPNGEVEICNAGHCYPLVVQRGQIASVESTGLPLGMFFNAEYEVRRIRMEPGDVLALYTDGFTECRNLQGIEYSEGRLTALVSREYRRTPEELVGVCMDDLRRFRDGAPKADDITVMILRRAQQPIVAGK